MIHASLLLLLWYTLWHQLDEFLLFWPPQRFTLYAVLCYVSSISNKNDTNNNINTNTTNSNHHLLLLLLPLLPPVIPNWRYTDHQVDLLPLSSTYYLTFTVIVPKTSINYRYTRPPGINAIFDFDSSKESKSKLAPILNLDLSPLGSCVINISFWFTEPLRISKIPYCFWCPLL